MSDERITVEGETFVPLFRRPVEFTVPAQFRERYPLSRCFAVKEACEVQDRHAWDGRLAILEGIGLARVIATERNMHCPPWREGENIAVLVELLE